MESIMPHCLLLSLVTWRTVTSFTSDALKLLDYVWTCTLSVSVVVMLYIVKSRPIAACTFLFVFIGDLMRGYCQTHFAHFCKNLFQNIVERVFADASARINCDLTSFFDRVSRNSNGEVLIVANVCQWHFLWYSFIIDYAIHGLVLPVVTSLWVSDLESWLLVTSNWRQAVTIIDIAGPIRFPYGLDFGVRVSPGIFVQLGSSFPFPSRYQISNMSRDHTESSQSDKPPCEVINLIT
jgi:hypothetical protein